MSSPTTAISILGTLHAPTSDPGNGSTPTLAHYPFRQQHSIPATAPTIYSREPPPLFPLLPGNFVPPPIPAIPVPAMAPTPGTAPYAPAPHSRSPSPSNSVPPTHSRNSSARNGTQPGNRTLPTRSPFPRPIPVVRVPRTRKGNLPQLFTDPLVLLSQPVALTLQ
ncbi:hypothetical protein DXG01_002732 [Tephrocybe rancida]|nr:hypothetical protein DXG01_002732 [Tephrocybe rancida]